jgi:hypothetical protein
LAGLRTLWLVEEQSLKRTSLKRPQTSKYRLVQIMYDVLYWFRTRVKRLKVRLQKFLVGDESSSEDGSVSIGSAMKEFVQGVIRGDDLSLSSSSSDGRGAKSPVQERRQRQLARIRAIVGSIIAVNLANALFAIISPFFWTVTAVAVGVIWPSWVSELLSRVSRLTAETRALGRGEELLSRAASPSSSSSSSSTMDTINNAKVWLGMYDHTKYHYYTRPDGTKRFYRTIGRGTKHPHQPSSTARLSPPIFEWPWNVELNSQPNNKKQPPPKKRQALRNMKKPPSNQQKRQPPSQQWGIFR